MAKKRINIYVDVDTYKDFKSILSVTGETVTDVFNYAMNEYINSIKLVIESGDKDTLFEMMAKKFQIQMDNLEKDIDKSLEHKNLEHKNLEDKK